MLLFVILPVVAVEPFVDMMLVFDGLISCDDGIIGSDPTKSYPPPITY